MKNKRFSVIVAVVFVMFSIQTLTPQSKNMQDRFYLGPFNFYFNEALRTPYYTSVYEALSYNAMQSYGAHLDEIPVAEFPSRNYDAGFFDKIANYKDFTNKVLNDWNITSKNPESHSLIIEREKIVRPAYGQRSTYEAENISVIPKYIYGTHQTGNANFTDASYGNRQVVYCSKQNNNKEGYMVSNLLENGEQSNQCILFDSKENSSGRSLFSDVKKSNYNYKWFIKPCMRIDANFAKQNKEVLVARIEIYCFNGDTKSIDLKCKNFLDASGNYSGDYIEMFTNLEDSKGDYNLSIPAMELASYTGNDGVKYKTPANKTDYRVYWYGNVDLWLDYVRLDDEWAHFLFTDPEDSNPKNVWKFHTGIKEEVEEFGSNAGFGYFYIDEMAYNNIPCLAEVNRLIKKYSNNGTSIIPIYCLICFNGNSGFKEDYDVTEMNNVTHSFLKNSGAISNIYLDETYPFFNDNKYPHNLKIDNATKEKYPATMYYKQASDREDYSQDISVSFKWWIHLYNESVLRWKSYPDYPFASMIQIHSDENPLTSGNKWFWREPTNEEISMQCYLAMTYGAKQIYQFMFHSDKVAGNNKYYAWGLVNLASDNSYSSMREKNYYGQNKYEYVKKLNKQLVTLGNYMYPPGEINKHFVHQTTKTVDIWNNPAWEKNSSGLPYTFIDSVNSFGHNDNSSAYNVPDNMKGRIFEIGFFENPVEPNSRYFLFLNKRCTPENGADLTGDSRQIKFYFNKSSLPSGYTNWELTDVITGEKVSFGVNAQGGVLFPYVFSPGEGRLLRLAPAS